MDIVEIPILENTSGLGLPEFAWASTTRRAGWPGRLRGSPAGLAFETFDGKYRHSPYTFYYGVKLWKGWFFRHLFLS